MPDNAPTPEGSRSPPAEPQFPTLTWRVFPARENVRRTAFVGVFLLAVVAFVAFAYGPPLALLTIVVLAVALNSYFIPTSYTFDRNGITTDKTFFRYTRPWNEFRGFIRTTNGVVISPFRNWTYLDNFRGLHLLLPKDREPVLRYLAEHLPEKKRPVRQKK